MKENIENIRIKFEFEIDKRLLSSLFKKEIVGIKFTAMKGDGGIELVDYEFDRDSGEIKKK